MRKREKNVVVEVTLPEFRMICDSLLELRNRLISEGKYTDPVDELLIKLMR